MGRILVVVMLIDSGYLMGIWPQWKWYSHGPVPKSQFIENYERASLQDPTLPKLRWQPIELRELPTDLLRAVLVAEDARFYRHDGFDIESFKSAMEYNWQQKRFVYGASTLSQQTAKNLFLSPSRNPMRKWHEFVITYAMESNINKRRILELYLNVAEFGRGVYGVEAAARRYWGKSAQNLTRDQALELAATLPAPVNHNPRTQTGFFDRHKQKIKNNLGW